MLLLVRWLRGLQSFVFLSFVKWLRTGFVRGFYRSWCVGWCKVSGGGCGVWLVGESWVWLLWEVEEFFLFVFAGAGFLGGFVGVALVAKYAEVF